ncbi:MAG: type II toxin-antitoxin system Phd/YefM family antitoxin [Myxococcaceae bacterium]|nr:type II toxin-antitoxin system Phd/YefM family antitoxin [Myxococcaceae bacterium]
MSDDILPIHEFKAKASAILGRVRKTGRPVVVTQNGRASAVVISTRDFDRLRRTLAVNLEVEAALAEVEAGRVVDDADFDEALAKARQRRRGR